MSGQIANERDIQFQIFEMLDMAQLYQLPRYEEHNEESSQSVLTTARQIAEKYLLPHYQHSDLNEPIYDPDEVELAPEVKKAWDVIAEAGLIGAHHSIEDGGIQLPEVIFRAALCYFFSANVASATYPMLTTGVANLVAKFASADLRDRFLPPLLDGRYSGTMALTEPDQGSALADVKTAAIVQPDGSYRLKGSKIFISAGDHNLTENIIHMVLARIEGAPAGVKGISLFICPKFLSAPSDTGGSRTKNDVALAGLLHKMGWKGATSTVLNFGENESCEAYLVGEPHQGLGYMFQMMNEARIGVGACGTMLGYRGYLYSLNYARERVQGRHPADKDPTSPQLPIIEHADVRRMLLAQKSYIEGSLQLVLYASYLVDVIRAEEDDVLRQNAAQLLDFLTPIVKAFPAEYGPKANDYAIQILGGAGYTKDHPVEQLYRDNRLNPIHEGTNGIQGLDLLGRKVPQQNMQAYGLYMVAVSETIAEAEKDKRLRENAKRLSDAVALVKRVTETSLGLMMKGDVEAGLANASVYLDIVGRVTIAWMWIRQAIVASRAINAGAADDEYQFYRGKLQACDYYFEWELDEVFGKESLLLRPNRTCLDMKDSWF